MQLALIAVACLVPPLAKKYFMKGKEGPKGTWGKKKD
jgi:hypothetical protein